MSDIAQQTASHDFSAQAGMRAAHAQKRASALSGRSQNDFICTARIDALLEP